MSSKMKKSEFFAPTRIISSTDCGQTLLRILEHEHPDRLAIMVDDNVASLPKVQQLLQVANHNAGPVTIVEVAAIEPSTDLVDQHSAQLKDNPPDLLVGIGGGSTLDLAKAVSVLVFNPGRAAEYQGFDLMPNHGCPSVMIPTTAGTGSEVTPGAVVLNPKTKRKGAIAGPYISPNYAVLDPELTLSMPAHVVVATGVDALAHAVESFTARCANEMTKMYSSEAFRMISGSLPAILAGTDSFDLRRNQLLGATLAGVAICNSDTGACHSMAYPLGIYFGVPHGVAVALLLPHVIAVNIRKGARNYAKLTDMLSEDGVDLSYEERCWQLQKFVTDLVPHDVPQFSLREYGLSAAEIPELARRGLDLRTALGNNPVEFTVKDARYVLEQLV